MRSEFHSKFRRRILQEWRGLPERTPPPDRGLAISEPLAKVMKNLGLSERLREGEVLAAWQELVGEFIATHAAPNRLVNGVLFVQVLQPTLRYELDRVWKPQILKKFKERFGAKGVRDIRFNLG